MYNNRTEINWFQSTLAFLAFNTFYLLVFRYMLKDLEAEKNISIFKPENVQIIIIALLVLLYHFCFLGLHLFYGGKRWQKIAAILVALFITASLLYGFNEWYNAAGNPFFRSYPSIRLPWYAREQTKFLITNGPLLIYITAVFILRIMMMVDKSRK